MKNIKYIILTLAIGMMLIVSSCKKTFYTDANINHNAPNYVPPVYLLPAIEINIGYTQGGDISRFTSLLTQQTAGVARQAAAYYTYVFTGQDFDQPWGNLYTECMENCLNIMKVADAKGYNGYGGIGRLLLAYTLQMTVDCWGSIPYSQAFLGVDNLNPGYDNDKVVYAAINQMVYDGITKMSNIGNDSPSVRPGGEDFIFGGSSDAWISFGHAMLARLFIHQSKNNNVAMADSALAHANLATGSGTGFANAVVPFSTSGTGNGPWSQFNNNRGGDINFAFTAYPQQTTLGSMLTSTNDPRYGILIDSSGELSTGVGLAGYYGNPNSPVEFITYEELLFITAEADVVTGNVAGAQTAYVNGITANMTKLGVDTTSINAYLVSHNNLGSNALDSIANQAYIALYLNPEAWSTFRRLNYPSLIPVTGSNGVPRRFLYPQTEYSYNGGKTPASTLWSPKVFWDN